MWTILWLIWIIFFGVIEGAAVFNKTKGDTLSEHIWKWFSIKSKAKGWRIRRFTLLALLTWLITHFLTGGNF